MVKAMSSGVTRKAMQPLIFSHLMLGSYLLETVQACPEQTR